MRPTLADFPRASQLSEVIADTRIKSIYNNLVCMASTLHTEIAIEASRIEVKILFKKWLICRIVPYRELLHLQIGESPVWEVRVRDENGYIHAFDRLLVEYLRIVSQHAEDLVSKEPALEG